MFERVRPNRGPHFMPKTFLRSKFSISKNKENISEQTSRKYALLYIKIGIETEHGRLAFHFDPMSRPRNFFLSKQGPHIC